MKNVERLDRLLHVLVRDDVRLARVDLVAVRVVVVKMRVDDVANGLRREQLQILDERTCRGRACAGVDDEHVATADDRHVVAAGDHRTGRGRVIHAVGDPFELVRLAGRDRIRRL